LHIHEIKEKKLWKIPFILQADVSRGCRANSSHNLTESPPKLAMPMEKQKIQPMSRFAGLEQIMQKRSKSLMIQKKYLCLKY